MGFVVKVKTRKAEDDEIIMRGNDDGTVDFCRPITIKDEPALQPYLFFSSLETAVERIFRMRCNNREANTLQELLDNVKTERKELRKEFGYLL